MSDFPAVPLVLKQKAPSRVHIVVGSLQCHVDFLAEVIAPGQEVRRVATDRLEDAPVIEALQGRDHVIFVLERDSRLSIAHDVRMRIGTWCAVPLKMRSAGIRVLVREAVTLMGRPELDQDRVDVIGDAVLDALGDDALPQAIIWEAAWHLSGADPGQAPSAWVHPWEDPWKWAQVKAPLPMRLNVLYKDLAGYVFGLTNDWKCAQPLGITPARFAWLKTLRLNLGKVEKAIVVLSRWRTSQDAAQALPVALQVGAIFA